MFKNRAVQVQMVKTPKKSEDDISTIYYNTIKADEFNKMATEQVKNVTLAIGALMVANKFLNTVNEIAIIAAKSKFR